MRKNLGKMHRTAAVITAVAMAISSPMTILADNTENTTESSSESSSEKEEKESKKDTDKGSDKDTDKGSDKDTDKGSDKGSDKDTDKDTDKDSDKDSDKDTDKASDKEEKEADKASDKEEKEADKASDKEEKEADKASDKEEKEADKEERKAEKEEEKEEKKAEKEAEKAEKEAEKEEKKAEKEAEKEEKKAEKEGQQGTETPSQEGQQGSETPAQEGQQGTETPAQEGQQGTETPAQNEAGNDDDYDPSVKPESPQAPQAPEAFTRTAPKAPVKPVLPVKNNISAPDAPALPEVPVKPDLEGLDAETANRLIDEYNAKVAAYNEAAEAYNGSIDQYNLSAEDYNTNEASFEDLMTAYNTSVNQYNLDVEAYNAELAQYLNDLAAYQGAANEYNTQLTEYAAELEKYNRHAEMYDAYIAGANAEAEQHNAEEDIKVAASQEEVDEYNRQLAEWTRRKNEKEAIQQEHESVIQAQYDALGDINRITRADIFGDEGEGSESRPDLSSIGYFDDEDRLVIDWDKMKKQTDAKTIHVVEAEEKSGLTYTVTNFHVYMKYNSFMDAIYGEYFNDYMERGWELEWHDGAVSLPKSLINDMLLIEYETVVVDKNDIVFFTNQANLFPTQYSSKDAAGNVNWNSTENTLMTGRYLEGRTAGDYWANDGMYAGNADPCDAEGNVVYTGVAGLNAGYTYRNMSDDYFTWYQDWSPNYINLYHQCTYNWFTWDSNAKPTAVTAYSPDYMEIREGAEKLENNYGELEIPEAEGEELTGLNLEEVKNNRIGFLGRLAALNSLDRIAVKAPEENKEQEAAPEVKDNADDDKAGSPKTEEKKDEVKKEETAERAEAPKAEAPKAEAEKAEAPKAEAPKAEAPKAEADRNSGNTSGSNGTVSERRAERTSSTEGGSVLGANREYKEDEAAAADEMQGEVLGASRLTTVTPEKGVLGAQRIQQVLGAERNPQTGDESKAIVWMAMYLAALAGLFGWIKAFRRKEEK